MKVRCPFCGIEFDCFTVDPAAPEWTIEYRCLPVRAFTGEVRRVHEVRLALDTRGVRL